MIRTWSCSGLLLLAGWAADAAPAPAGNSTNAAALLLWTAMGPTNTQTIQTPSGGSAGRIVPQAQGYRFYDNIGNFRGRAERSGNQQSVFDASGRYAGRVLADTNGARFYEAQGQFAGRAVRRGTTLSYYDRNGAYVGRSTTSGSSVRYYDSQGRNVKELPLP